VKNNSGLDTVISHWHCLILN